MGIRFALPTGNAVSHYGTRTAETRLPSEYQTSQGDKVQTITFTFDDLPVISATDQSVLDIDANSYIVSAIWRTVVPFAGGTTYDVGLTEADGTAIDANGLFAALALANINVIGETNLGGGTLVGLAAGIGGAAGQVVVAATGTFTAGKAQLEIVYRTLDDRASF